MISESFTFTELDKRIEKVPDAPGELELSPKSLMVWEFIGICGTILGLVPSLIVLFITPAMWMVDIANAVSRADFCRSVPWPDAFDKLRDCPSRAGARPTRLKVFKASLFVMSLRLEISGYLPIFRR